MVDPGTKADCDVRETFQIIDDNTQEMKMYVMTPDGKEFNTMAIKYTRKEIGLLTLFKSRSTVNGTAFYYPACS